MTAAFLISPAEQDSNDLLYCHYFNKPIKGARRFDLVGLDRAALDGSRLTGFSSLSDDFAPAGFKKMSEKETLAAPAFEGMRSGGAANGDQRNTRGPTVTFRPTRQIKIIGDVDEQIAKTTGDLPFPSPPSVPSDEPVVSFRDDEWVTTDDSSAIVGQATNWTYSQQRASQDGQVALASEALGGSSGGSLG